MLVRYKKTHFLNYFLGEEYEYVENTRNDRAYRKEEQSASIYTQCIASSYIHYM